MGKFYYNDEQDSYDEIVIGTDISGGWAAKELCQNGLKTLVLERGRMVEHIKDYTTAHMDPWDFPNGGQPTKEMMAKQGKQKANDEALENYMGALEEGTAIRLDDNVAVNAFAKNLRGMTILGYKTSEFVGKEVLEYLPVPGQYVSFGNTEELTGGKAWSL